MLRRLRNKIKSIGEDKFPRWAMKSPLLAGLYYTFISDRFHREHQAVLAGKVKFVQRNQNNEENKYFLSRSIHRLEKGLLMRPMRPIFGLDYIKSTIDAYLAATKDVKSKEGLTDQLIWAKDVLSTYFSTIEHNELTTKLERRFSASNDKYELRDTEVSLFAKRVPKARKHYETNPVSYENFKALCLQRRSVRWFLEKPVPRELIDKAILAATQAPSACNRQPFHYYVIDDPKSLAVIKDMPMGTKGYGHSIKAMIVTVGHLDAYSHERDRHLIYIDTSLANMLLMLSLETLGLASCPINWPDIENREKKLGNFLGLTQEQRPVMMIGVGYPDPEGKIAYSQKAGLEEVRTFTK